MAVHAALALFLFVGTDRTLAPSAPNTESVIETALRFLLPPDRPGPTAADVQAKWSSTPVGTTALAIPGVTAERTPPLVTPVPDSEKSIAPLPLAEAAAAQNAFTLLDVDSGVVRDPSSAVPVYPRTLERQGIEGVAVVRFVVDTTGRADVATFQLVETNHPLFGAAVRAALAGMKFHPATVGSQKVRQLVELPFGFRIIGRTTTADATRKPRG